uniref:Uncharacterized protein n=1 Tax=viral metagenome TaxID=1070528 RepID=A0A6C0B406_9ZZZZ
MLQSNIYNYNITKTNNKEELKKTAPIYIKDVNVSYNPHCPNTPPQNTPPNINVIRQLYLNYLTSFKK